MNKSWVRSRFQMELSDSVLSIPFSVADNSWGGIIDVSSDTILKSLKDKLGKGITKQCFTQEQLALLAESASYYIFDRCIESYFDALDAVDWDEDKVSLDYNGCCAIHLVPLLCTTRSVLTNKEKHRLSYLCFVQIPGYSAGGKTFLNSDLGGWYCRSMDLIFCTVPEDGKLVSSAFHEVIHLVTRALLDDVELRDNMYGQNDSERVEEIMTHLFTDCFTQMEAIRSYMLGLEFNNSPDGCSVIVPKVEFSRGERFDGSDDAVTIKSKSKTIVNCVGPVPKVRKINLSKKSKVKLKGLKSHEDRLAYLMGCNLPGFSNFFTLANKLSKLKSN